METTGGALKSKPNEPRPLEQEQDVIAPPAEIATVVNNRNHVEGQETYIKKEGAGHCAQTMGLDPQTGLLYTITGIT